jgi:hypothetical protein
MIGTEPFDEQPRVVFDGGIWPESDDPFQVRTIGASLQSVARLHRQQFLNGRTACEYRRHPSAMNVDFSLAGHFWAGH